MHTLYVSPAIWRKSEVRTASSRTALFWYCMKHFLCWKKQFSNIVCRELDLNMPELDLPECDLCSLWKNRNERPCMSLTRTEPLFLCFCNFRHFSIGENDGDRGSFSELTVNGK